MSRYHSPVWADDEDEPYDDNVQPDAAYYQCKYTSNTKFPRQPLRDVTWISHTSRSRSHYPSQSQPPPLPLDPVLPTSLCQSGATRWKSGSRGRNQNLSCSQSRSTRTCRPATSDPDEDEYMNVDPYELFSGQSPQSPTTPVDWQAVGPREEVWEGS